MADERQRLNADDIVRAAAFVYEAGEIIDDVWYPGLASRLGAFADNLSAASSGDPEAQRAVCEMLGMEGVPYTTASLRSEVDRRDSHWDSPWFRWPALPSEPKEHP